MNKLERKMEEVRVFRHRLLNVMKSLPSDNAAVVPNSVYRAAESALTRETCNVAFCGRTNCGKSSLVNAIIGKSILPVGDRPITSRIVEVSNCADIAEEGFSIIMNNGDEHVFNCLNELSQFATEHGVQMVEGIHLECISHVELKTRIPHLPKGIRIVDTPGIGSVHKEHSALTYYYLEKADAVVYVMRSDSELVETDIEFLKNVYAGNQNIIFVQTMVDTNGMENALGIKARNLKLLREIFPVNGGSIPYFCLAPYWLNKEKNEETEYMNSEFNAEYSDFLLAWERLLFRTAGMDVLCRALTCAAVYVEENIRVFNTRIDAAKGSCEAEKKCLLAAETVCKFRSEWMGEGNKVKNLLANLESTVSQMKDDMLETMNALECKVTDEIAAATDNRDCDRLVQSLQERIRVAWRKVQDRCVDRMNVVLEELSVSTPYAQKGILLKDGQLIKFELDGPGFKDLYRIISAGLHALYGNIVGVLVDLGRFILGILNREKANRKRRDAAETHCRALFNKLRSSLSEAICAKKGLIVSYYCMGAELVNRTVTERYMELGNEAVQLLSVAKQAESERRAYKARMQAVLARWKKQGEILTARMNDLKIHN